MNRSILLFGLLAWSITANATAIYRIQGEIFGDAVLEIPAQSFVGTVTYTPRNARPGDRFDTCFSGVVAFEFVFDLSGRITTDDSSNYAGSCAALFTNGYGGSVGDIISPPGRPDNPQFLDYILWRIGAPGGEFPSTSQFLDDIDGSDFRLEYSPASGEGIGIDGSITSANLVPEPATVALFSLGLLGVAYRRRQH